VEPTPERTQAPPAQPEEKKDAEPEKTDPEPNKDAEPEKEAEPDKKEAEPEKKDAEPEKEADPEKKPDGAEKKDAAPVKKPEFRRTPILDPLGAAGRSTVKTRETQQSDHFMPMPDRWRIGMPAWERYRGGRGAPFKRGRWWDPYNQNVLKGDYPIWGQNKFLELTFSSDTIAQDRRLFVPSNVSAAGPGRFGFFGYGKQLLVDQTFLFSGEVFRGDTAFKPKDWAFRITPAFNINHLSTRETGLVNVDVRQGTSRTNVHLGFQELFGEYKIRDLSPFYDFVATRAGIQTFNADFRGFLFFDQQPGIRLFGNTRSNENQFNLTYFRPLEKDTYSRLNTIFEDRDQNIFIANFFRQDLFRPGYTGQVTLAYNNDQASVHYNNNGIRTRPSLIGDALPHTIRVGYLGFNGDGHFGRLNISHSFYQAWGKDSRNPIAGRSTSINAQMAAAELSYDKDWARFKTAFFYASGDANPRDRRARGFDAIFDQPFFLGGPFSFFNSQGQALTSTGVELFGEGSLLPSLRGSRLEGQANFVNPGIMIVNAGVDLEVTPKWRLSANVNWINFMKTQSLELILNQSDIGRSVGFDYNLGFRYRPYLNDNVVLLFGASALVPGKGFQEIFENKTLYSVFGRLILTF
jgi:hypothetical protein